MGDIIDFLKGIADAFTAVLKYGINMISDLVNFAKNLAQLPGQLSNSFGLFPSVLIPFLVYAIGVVILLRVLDRY